MPNATQNIFNPTTEVRGYQVPGQPLPNGWQNINLAPGNASPVMGGAPSGAEGGVNTKTGEITGLKPAPTVVTDADIRESKIPNTIAQANSALGNTQNNAQTGQGGQNGQGTQNGATDTSGTQNNAQGGDTTRDYSKMSYEDIYKSVLGDVNGQPNDQITNDQMSLIKNMMASSDASTRVQLSAIQAGYAEREQLLKEEQESSSAGLKNLLFTSGAYRTGGASGALDQKALNDMRGLSSLANEEKAAEAAVYKAKQEQDYQMLSKQLDILAGVRDKKLEMAKTIADNIQTANKESRDRLQKVQDDISGVLKSAATNNAPPEVRTAISASKNLNDAIAAAGEYLQTATGSLGDYLQYKRDTQSKGLTPKDYQTWSDEKDAKTLKDKITEAVAVQKAKNQDAEFTASDKNQQKLEQQYRQVLSKEFSSRTGALGIENIKVNQANHLNSLFTQYYDKKTGQYNVPKSQYAELAMGLANLISPTGTVTEGAREAILQRTAKGDLNGAITYITGTPQNGTTDAVIRNLVDSVDRQAATAVRNREAALDDLRAQAPTDLEQSRIDKLNRATKMVEYEGQERASKKVVMDYVTDNPSENENIAKLYEVPGATSKDIEDYLHAQGKI